MCSHAPHEELSRLSPARLGRAHRFIERARTLDSAAWDDAVQRAHAADQLVERLASRRLRGILAGRVTPDGLALARLNWAACAAVPPSVATATCEYAGRVAAHAALALALSDELLEVEVAALYAPFADAVPLDSLASS